MYGLTKFQPEMPLALGVIALQSGNNKKINLYWKTKLQALTKMDVNYKWNVTWSCNWVSFSLCYPSSPCIETKSVKENGSHTKILT